MPTTTPPTSRPTCRTRLSSIVPSCSTRSPSPDEELLEKYLESGELTEDEIRAGIRKLTINREAYPVLCGSAFKDKGVQPMLDAVVDYLPSPEDVPSIVGFDPQDESIEIDRKPTTDDPFSALVFKISTHPFYGKLVFVRVTLFRQAGRHRPRLHQGRRGTRRQDLPDARRQGGTWWMPPKPATSTPSWV